MIRSDAVAPAQEVAFCLRKVNASKVVRQSNNFQPSISCHTMENDKDLVAITLGTEGDLTSNAIDSLPDIRIV